ncbi:thiamine pyrophosphate-binding protein [Kutzneria kofuensis]|uniref:Benzoylformate decarboxylase n=1 Tax=Kutzneria kofuensis TaxID=103725 RepID=A0A7W9NKT7_9PSEU|nr:thiamine pyrophosphate-binding protein [Kutzneria kofuensis]MBB5896992.1 benzoylformate decarboxylase [Kutzneria kofuensis]
MVYARPGTTALYEQLAADGVRHMFGNPGTVEQGFLDAAADSGIEYVLALQETVAVAMADGYARAGERPAVVQLHSGVGLGNGIGMLYQAMRGQSPLVILVGEAGIRYEAMQAQMAADLIGMARPVTKQALRVLDSSSLLRVLRRAVQVAMTPPRGPVVVVLPADVMDEVTTEPAMAASVPSTRVLPAPNVVAEAARLLRGGQHPLILMGDGVAASGAQAELAAVAGALRAPVWGVNSSELNMDTTHPLYGGQLGHMFGADSARVVAEADAVLVVATYLFPEVYPSLSGPFRTDASVVHIDLDPDQIAKNHPVSLGVVADPKLTLEALAVELERTAPRPLPARRRSRGTRPPEPSTLLDHFVARLARRAPRELIVVDEALTAAGSLARHLPAQTPGRFFQTRGGSLGVGFPGAIGAKLARPGAPVIAFSGDGATMYTVQALWTAARHDVDAKFVVCNNGRYQLLDDNLEQYWREQGRPARAHPRAFDLSKPPIGFVDLAASLGVPGCQVSSVADVDEAVARMLGADGPFLVDVDTTPEGT